MIPSQTIADSDTKKKRSKKTLAQLPVYRSVANLKFVVTTLMMKSPRKLTKFFDQMLGTISEAKKAIGMADISRSPQDRSWYLDCARVLMQDVSDDFTTLRRLEMHQHKRYLQPVSHGLAFVGSYIKPKRVYLSNRTLARFEERAVGFSRIIYGDAELTVMDCKRIEQVINSYLGFCKGKKTYGKRKKILGMMGKNFFKYFYIKGHYESIRAKAKYREIVLPYQIAA